MNSFEKNFEKKLKEEGSFKIKIRNEGDLNAEVSHEIRKVLDEDVKRAYEDAKKSSLDLEKTLGEGVTGKVESLYLEVKEIYKKLGYPDVELPPVFLMPTTFEQSGTVGHTNSVTHIEMTNLNIEDKTLKQLAFLDALGHELYHSVAQTSLSIRPDHPKGNTMDASGSSYATNEREMALEEGLACHFQDYVFEAIKKKFDNKVIEKYQKLLKRAVDNEGVEDVNDLGRFNLLEQKEDGSFKYGKNKEYKSSKILVAYLNSQIPNFENLVEAARIERKTLPLARAIESRFGKGSYGKVTTASTDEAEQLLKDLKLKTL